MYFRFHDKTKHIMYVPSCTQLYTYLPNAVLHRARQGKLRTPARAHAKTRSVYNYALKTASACLRHCQKMVNRRIVTPVFPSIVKNNISIILLIRNIPSDS